jgi:hypothetical protein
LGGDTRRNDRFDLIKLNGARTGRTAENCEVAERINLLRTRGNA